MSSPCSLGRNGPTPCFALTPFQIAVFVQRHSVDLSWENACPAPCSCFSFWLQVHAHASFQLTQPLRSAHSHTPPILTYPSPPSTGETGRAPCDTTLTPTWALYGLKTRQSSLLETRANSPCARPSIILADTPSISLAETASG